MTNGLKLIAALLALLLFPATGLADSPIEPLQIEQITNLGVPAGNAPLPKFLALDESAGLIYVLCEGEFQQGNQLAVFDLESGEFTRQVRLNQGEFEPLDLQFDPTSGLLYARWQERYSGAPPMLAVIDSKVMQVSQQIPNIEAFAVGNGLLYAATATELLAVNLSNNSLDQARRASLPLAATTGPMALDAGQNRLYLARRGDSPTIEIFEAGTLSPLASYPAENDVLNLLPIPGAGQAFYTTDQGGFRVLGRITSSGELADLPIELGPYSGAAGMAVSPDGRTLFFSNGQWGSEPGQQPALAGVDRQTFLQTHTIPLLSNVNDVVVTGSAAYAVDPYNNHLYLIDLTSATVDIENTAIRLRDVLFDAAANRLFVTDSANRVRQLDPQTLSPQTETRLQNNWADFGFKNWGWSGQLALDAGRRQLYVSGLPATVLDAGTLAELTTIAAGGQFAPDPGGDNLYLSNCGVTVLSANTLTGTAVISGTTARPDGLAPNPCVTDSLLDSDNRWLYSLVSNGVPGSNAGSYLYVYDVTSQPTLVFSDTNISITGVAPDPAARRAFVSAVRHSNRRVRALDVAAGSYNQQLMGVWGELRFSPASQRVYVADQGASRILALDAATLNVVDELLLPDTRYQLVEIDPATDRLFLIDDRGNLLTAAPGATPAANVGGPAAPPAQPDGPLLSVELPANSPIIARVDSSFGQFSHEARLVSSTDFGQNWADIGRGLPPLPVQTVAVSPNFASDQTLFAGVLLPGQTGGLYKSVDGGQSWQPAMTGLRDIWIDSLTIAPDFAKTGLIFAETVYGGLHYSTDAGDTWQPVAAQNPNAAFPASSGNYAVAIGPKSILISQPLAEMRGLFRASRRADGSPSAWQQVLDQPAQLLAASPDGMTALAYGAALWRSADSGYGWQIGGAGLAQIGVTQPARIAFSPDFKTDQTIYFFFRDAAGTTQAQLFRSTDGGQTWLNWQPPAEPMFTALAQTASGELVLGDAAAGLVQQPPANLRWSATNLPAELFPVDSVAAGGNGAALFAINSTQGLFKSTNGGRGWQRTDYPARAQYFGSQPFQVAVSKSGKTVFVASGLSLHRSANGGATWQELSAGDGSLSFLAQRVALSPNFDDDRTLLASTPTAVYRSTDGGDNWAKVLTIEANTNTGDVLAFTPDGRGAYVRFGYGQNLYRSDDGGQTWQLQPVASGDEFLSILSAAVNADGVLSVAAEYERKLLQTGPQTPPWRTVSDSLPAELTGLNAVAYRPDGALLIAGPGGLFSSSDNGQNWQPVDAFGLPAGAVITRLAASESGLLAALDTGALFSLPAGESGWKNISIIK